MAMSSTHTHTGSAMSKHADTDQQQVVHEHQPLQHQQHQPVPQQEMVQQQQHEQQQQQQYGYYPVYYDDDKSDDSVTILLNRWSASDETTASDRTHQRQPAEVYRTEQSARSVAAAHAAKSMALKSGLRRPRTARSQRPAGGNFGLVIMLVSVLMFWLVVILAILTYAVFVPSAIARFFGDGTFDTLVVNDFQITNISNTAVRLQLDGYFPRTSAFPLYGRIHGPITVSCMLGDKPLLEYSIVEGLPFSTASDTPVKTAVTFNVQDMPTFQKLLDSRSTVSVADFKAVSTVSIDVWGTTWYRGYSISATVSGNVGGNGGENTSVLRSLLPGFFFVKDLNKKLREKFPTAPVASLGADLPDVIIDLLNVQPTLAPGIVDATFRATFESPFTFTYPAQLLSLGFGDDGKDAVRVLLSRNTPAPAAHRPFRTPLALAADDQTLVLRPKEILTWDVAMRINFVDPVYSGMAGAIAMYTFTFYPLSHFNMTVNGPCTMDRNATINLFADVRRAGCLWCRSRCPAAPAAPVAPVAPAAPGVPRPAPPPRPVLPPSFGNDANNKGNTISLPSGDFFKTLGDALGELFRG
ncbi:hypothetical protein BC831DRAFT_452535 [Entophlyctis helioformis]|nr:hypothetical protein BC831DRAFT_452535 [Entophlyctis helioformis]